MNIKHNCTNETECQMYRYRTVDCFDVDVLIGRSTMMRKIHSCAMLAATANMPSLTSPSHPGRAVQSTQLRMKMIVKRFICRCTLLTVCV